MIKNLKNFLCFFIFFVIFTNLNAQSSEIIKNIKVNGNNRISSETIILFSGAEINQKINENNLNIFLKNLYDTNYFKDVKVNFINEELEIIVQENPVIYIIFEGIKAKKIKNEIKNNISAKESSYNELTLINDKEKDMGILGYYFPTVEVLIEDKSNNIFDIIFKIDVGNKTKIRSINFTGNKFFKENKLKSIIVSEEYKPWKFISGRKFLKKENVEFDKRLLKNFYLNKGFYNVEINSSFAKLNRDDDFDLVFNIRENERFYFDNLSLNLPTDYNLDNYSDILKLFTNLKGKAYSISNIEKIINEIDKISVNEQFETIKSTVVESINENKISLEFNVEETEKVVVQKINLLGNNVTKESNTKSIRTR